MPGTEDMVSVRINFIGRRPGRRGGPAAGRGRAVPQQRRQRAGRPAGRAGGPGRGTRSSCSSPPAADPGDRGRGPAAIRREPARNSRRGRAAGGLPGQPADGAAGWGRIGAPGSAVRPRISGCCASCAWSGRAGCEPRVRGCGRRMQPAARPGIDATGDLLRLAGPGPARRLAAGPPSSFPGWIVILALSALFLAGTPPRWMRGGGPGAGAAVAAVAEHAGWGWWPANWKRAAGTRPGAMGSGTCSLAESPRPRSARGWCSSCSDAVA